MKPPGLPASMVMISRIMISFFAGSDSATSSVRAASPISFTTGSPLWVCQPPVPLEKIDKEESGTARAGVSIGTFWKTLEKNVEGDGLAGI